MLKVIATSIIVFLLLSFTSLVEAEECDGLGLNEKIKCLTTVKDRLGSQSKTLASQVAQFDAQIKLTSLKISQTEEQINLLSGRIGQIVGSVDSLTKAFSERAVETYKMTRVGDMFLLLISADDLNDAFNRVTYLKKIQESDRSLLERLQKAQVTYEEQKTDQEDLQNQLETQQKQLNTQKLAKKTLLDQTKSDEKRYQALLNQALAEKAAIENALKSGIKVGPVKAGDPIALVGNSGYPGCSTGKHLHFEIRKNNTWVDPSSYLQSKSVNDEEKGGTANIGSGSWPWPIQDTVRLTQYFGHTSWSWVYKYSGGIHTGLDMVSTSSDVIRAPADGNLFKSSQSCGGSSTINIVYIEHNDGVISLYLHVQ